MPMDIPCPRCSKIVRLPGEFAGRMVRCGGCEHVFTAPEAGVTKLPSRPREPEPTDLRSRPSRRDFDEDEYPRRRRYPDGDEDDDYGRWDIRRRGGREYARSRVQGPGILLQIYGVLLILGSCVSVLPIFAVLMDLNAAKKPTPGEREDAIATVVIFAIIAGVCLVAGPVILWGGTRMKQLRSYGLAMAATVLTFVIGALTCIPLVAVGIWPVIVLGDSRVKQEFE
jgi:hypothetical protein